MKENKKSDEGKKKVVKSKKEINPKKIKEVEKLAEKIKESRTIFVAGIKNLPSKQFQDIRKKLRDNAEIKMSRVRLMKRAIDQAGVGAKKIEPYIKENTVVMFSNLDPFELSSILADNKTPAAAKAGDIVNEDINIEPGPTDLVPGPVISELGALGLKIAVEDGKISIKEGKTIVQAGEEVSGEAASLMQKLDIKPLSIGFEPVAAYDNKDKQVYTDIKIDKEGTLNTLKEMFGKALGFANNIGYVCKETIKLMLGKASAEYNRLSGLIKEEKPEEEEEEEKKDEEKTETADKAEEKKEEDTQSENKSEEESK